MKKMKITIAALLAVLITQIVIAQVGRPFIHDPSTSHGMRRKVLLHLAQVVVD
jgi:hypothetical protein